MASIQIDGVEKRFGGRVVVQNLTLDIAAGELLVVVGPSGSGKSTLLRLIAGLEAPDSGHIRIGGVDVTGTPPQQRDLAMVFQHYALYPHMTVRENLLFGLRMRRLAAAESAARVETVARSLRIHNLLDRRPAQLSGGERQRVAFGRAVVRQPRAFLLDEPLSNLDPRLRSSTRAELALLHRRLGTTMVYVTHDQEEAMTLGTRVAVMQGGSLEQVAAPMELYTAPANRFVGEFVGSPAMNLIASHRLITAAPAMAGRIPDPAIVGVRPHDIELTAAGEGDASGRVAVVEMLGSAVLLHVAVTGIDDELVRVLVGDLAPVTADTPVGLRFRSDRLHMFDPAGGARFS